MAPTTTHTTTQSSTRCGKEATMATTIVPTQKVGQVVTVDLTNTVGQESAIEANGGPLFQIRVTCPASELPPTLAGEPQDIGGFGRVVSGGPVQGYEVYYRTTSVV